MGLFGFDLICFLVWCFGVWFVLWVVDCCYFSVLCWDFLLSVCAVVGCYCRFWVTIACWHCLLCWIDDCSFRLRC